MNEERGIQTKGKGCEELFSNKWGNLEEIAVIWEELREVERNRWSNRSDETEDPVGLEGMQVPQTLLAATSMGGPTSQDEGLSDLLS